MAVWKETRHSSIVHTHLSVCVGGRGMETSQFHGVTCEHYNSVWHSVKNQTHPFTDRKVTLPPRPQPGVYRYKH